MLTVQDLAKSMDLSKQIDLILLDFLKAFDKVPHERLLYKAQYNRNINGPMTLPCGTQEENGAVCEDCPSTSTR
jgi:hypothetical protein